MFRRRFTILSASVSVIAGLLIIGAPGTTPAIAGPRGSATGPVWATVSVGGDHTCGIRTGHTLWCWGNNQNGQLGLGDTLDRHVPTRV